MPALTSDGVPIRSATEASRAATVVLDHTASVADRGLAIVRLGAEILAEEGSPNASLRQLLEARFEDPTLTGLAWLARLAIDLGEAEGAAVGVSAAREAEQLIGRPTDWRLRVFTSLVLSEIHERAGHLARSRDYLLDLLSALDHAPDDREVAAVRMDCRRRLGRVALGAGDVDEARSNLEAACRPDVDGPVADRLRAAAQRLLSITGVVDPFAYASIPLPDAGDSDEDHFEQLLFEGLGALQDGSPTEAKQCAQRLLQEAGAARSPRHEIRAYWLLAEIALDRGRQGTATKYLEKAADRAVLASDAQLLCRTEIWLAELCLHKKNFVAARSHAARGLEHCTDDATFGTRFDTHVVSARSLAGGAKPDIGAALRHALEAVRLRTWMRTQQGNFETPTPMDASIFNLDELALRLAAAADDGLAAFSIMEQGRSQSMSALLTNDLASHERGSGAVPGETVALLNAARSLRRSIELRFAIEGPVSLASHIRWKLDHAAVLAREASLERQLADELGRSARLLLDGEDTDYPGRPPKLPDNNHLLYVQVGTDSVHAARVYFVLISGANEPEIDSAPLDSGQVALLSVLTTSLPSDYPMEKSRQELMESESDPCWAELADRLLPQRLKELLVAEHDQPDHQQPSLTIVPFYYLWRFPFAALQVKAEPDLRLIDCATIGLTPSSRFLRPASGPGDNLPRRGRRSIRALGYLPILTAESQVELERSALDAAYTFTEAENADELLMLMTKGDEYDLVTMSVHGDDVPKYAHGLHLDASRTLTAADLLGLRMPRQLVLGACCSGTLVANSNEPIGLATVAFVRGATSVTAAPLRIPDAATAAVLAELYRELSAGTRPALALRRAQLHVRASSERRAPPWDWAGLTTISRELP